jgi:homocitrate synthase NifV
MATANCLAAIEQGASAIDATVLGIGDRAGIARLEELVGYFALAQGDRRFFPEHLTSLCALVAAASGSTIDARHPVIGRALFSTESGIHIDGIAKDARTYEPFSPDKVGARRRFLYGQKSGRGALRVALAAWGMKPEDVDLPKVLAQVRALSSKLGRPLNRREIEALLA